MYDKIKKREGTPVSADVAPARESDGTQYNQAMLEMLRVSSEVHSAGDRPLTLPDDVKSRIEARFAVNPNQVQLYESSEVARMGAHAYARGDVIKFAPGAFNPRSQEGLQSIGHEFSHIRQQAAGGYRPNVDGLNVHHDTHTEAQSDFAGRTFANGDATYSGFDTAPVTPIAASAAPIQGLFGSIKRHFKNKKAAKLAQKKQGALAALNTAEMQNTLNGNRAGAALASNDGYIFRHMKPFYGEDADQNAEMLGHVKSIMSSKQTGVDTTASVQALSTYLQPMWQRLLGEDVSGYKVDKSGKSYLQNYSSIANYKDRGTEMLEILRNVPGIREQMGVTDEQFNEQRERNTYMGGIQRIAEDSLKNRADLGDDFEKNRRKETYERIKVMLRGKKNFKSFRKAKPPAPL